MATDDRPISLLHPHGTTRWYQPAGKPSLSAQFSMDDGVQQVAEGESIAIGQRGDVWDVPKGERLFPAIAIPMREDFNAKTKWPQSQIDEFARFAPKVSRILSIGWAARDAHILDKVSELVPSTSPVHVVSVDDANEIASRFAERNFSKLTATGDGFSGFCISLTGQESQLDRYFSE